MCTRKLSQQFDDTLGGLGLVRVPFVFFQILQNGCVCVSNDRKRTIYVTKKLCEVFTFRLSKEN
jgi:hypothetical protein